MKEKTKNLLIEHNKVKKWDTDDGGIIETVLELGEEKWVGKQDRHRWYSMIPTVVSILGVFLQFNRCDVHGEEADVDDCIGGYKLDDFVEVAPKTVETIIYEPVK